MRLTLFKSWKFNLVVVLTLLTAIFIALLLQQKTLQTYDADKLGQNSNATWQKDPEQKWIIELESSDLSARIRAAESLAAAGPSAVEPLCKCLKHNDRAVRRHAAIALRRMGPTATQAVPALIDCLKDADRQVVKEAVGALGEIGPASEAAIPSIAQLLDEADGSLRLAAIESLGRIGDAANPVLQERLTAESDISWRIAIELSKLSDPTEEVARVLCKRLAEFHEQDPQQRAVAFDDVSAALVRIKTIAVPQLLQLLDAGSSEVRDRVVRVLGRIGPAAKDAVPALIKALEDDDSSIRSNAATALGAVGPDAVRAIPAMIRGVKSGRLGASGVRSLVILGTDENQLLECFIDCLKSDQLDVRMNGTRGLGLLGPKASGSLAALREAMKDDNPQVRLQVGQAIWKITGNIDLSLPLLVEILEDQQSASLWEEAAATLGEMGPAAKGAVPVLVKITKSAHKSPSIVAALKLIDEAAAAGVNLGARSK